MKAPKEKNDLLKKIANTVSLRMLKKTVELEVKETAFWTPLEGIPVSIPLHEIGRPQGIRPAL
jgi:hypothetical protein